MNNNLCINNISNNKEYFTTRDRRLANCLAWVTNERYLVFNDKFNAGKVVYTFNNTDTLKKALVKVFDLRNELKLDVNSGK